MSWTHIYAGLALSLLLLVLAVTGGALVYKEAYWRAVYPELRADALDLAPAEHAMAIAAAEREFGETLLSIKMPEPGVGAYHLYLEGGEAFLSAVDQHLIDRWHPRDRVMSFLFDLHAHLMAGEAGERVSGVIGLLGVLLTVTGLILWWPARRRFALADLRPRDLSRRSLLVWHRSLGALTSPILLLLLLTGSGLVFSRTATALLSGVFGDRATTAVVPTGPANLAGSAPDAAMLAEVASAFPGGRVVFYYPLRAGDTVHRFRLKQPCELHPNGRSYVYLDLAGRLVGKADACALPIGQRAANGMYPLHSGKTESGLYKFATFLGALSLAGLSLSGVVVYLKKGWGMRAR